VYRPEPTEYAPAVASYVALVPEDDILAVLDSQGEEMIGLLRAVSEEQGGVRHPPYTWSIKEVVGHLIDSERIFAARALRFARADTAPLPGFDEQPYVHVAGFDRLPLAALVAELEAARRSHVWLFRNLPAEAWPRTGVANGHEVSVRALAYILAGHARHHTAILRRRLFP
jgi:hypothetical protein